MALTDNDCNRGTNGVLKQQTTATRHVMELLLITQARAPAIAPGFTVALPAGGQRWARWNPAVAESEPVWECGVGEGCFRQLMLTFKMFYNAGQILLDERDHSYINMALLSSHHAYISGLGNMSKMHVYVSKV